MSAELKYLRRKITGRNVPELAREKMATLERTLAAEGLPRFLRDERGDWYGNFYDVIGVVASNNSALADKAQAIFDNEIRPLLPVNNPILITDEETYELDPYDLVPREEYQLALSLAPRNDPAFNDIERRKQFRWDLDKKCWVKTIPFDNRRVPEAELERRRTVLAQLPDLRAQGENTNTIKDKLELPPTVVRQETTRLISIGETASRQGSNQEPVNNARSRLKILLFNYKRTHPSELINLSEAARELGISRERVRQLYNQFQKQGLDIPAVKGKFIHPKS